MTEARPSRSRQRRFFLVHGTLFTVLVVLAIVFYDSAPWLVPAAATYVAVALVSELIERHKRRK